MRLQLVLLGRDTPLWLIITSPGVTCSMRVSCDSTFAPVPLYCVTPLCLSITSCKRDLRINKAVTGLNLHICVAQKDLPQFPLIGHKLGQILCTHLLTFRENSQFPIFFSMTFILTWCLLPLVAAHVTVESAMEELQQIDLTYITERIITIYCPAECPEQIYRGNLHEIIFMLQSKHRYNYLVRWVEETVK